MSKKGLIEKMNSKYILNTIFDYISNENFKLKLFAHSKLLQEKFDFKIEYKYSILKEYLIVKDFILLNIINRNLDTNYFYKKLNDILDFINLTKEESKEISKVIYNNYIKEQKKIHKIITYTDYLSTIDIYSPFIESAISNDFHFINVPLDDIQKYALSKDYISFFKKQNEDDKKYKILISLKNAKQIDLLRQIQINFSNINQFIFVYMNNFYYFNAKSERTDPILNSIYSLVNIPDVLEVLDLYFDKHYSITDLYFPKWFNNLTNLKELKMRGLDFNSQLIISLPKLEIIKFDFCHNIDFLHEIVDNNLKYLELFNTPLISKKPHIFENLEELKISQSGDCNIDLDFSLLKKLKKYSASNLSLVKKISLFPLLEEFTFIPNKNYHIEDKDGEIFNLIISNKTINKIDIELPNLKNKDLEISIINQNINDISLNKVQNQDYSFELFLQKFSNIKKLKFETIYTNFFLFDLIENKNIIIEELELPNPIYPVYFSFSYLRSLSIDFHYHNHNYKDLPFFNSGCPNNFNSLENLKISISEEPFDIKLLQKFANNIKCFNNLKKITFKFYVDKIKQKIYFDSIEKILSLNLILLHISFDINGWNEFYKVHYKFYTRSELKKVFNEKIKDNPNYIYKIQRVKGQEENKMEKKLNEKCLIL